jgi:hypothetical protein
MEHVLRSWLIASRLGARLGLDHSERAALYYVSMLAWVGCVADTPEVAESIASALIGDSQSAELDVVHVLPSCLGTLGSLSFMVTGRRGVWVRDVPPARCGRTAGVL